MRLAAALAIQGLYDATDTSPRMDRLNASRNECSDPNMPDGQHTIVSQSVAGSTEQAVDPLARLASSALLPVLRLTLHMKEIDSRWRMGQLLVRLLARLAAAPNLLALHYPALTEWLPTAWAACDGEQLLLEATLDAADTMLASCPSQHPPHLPLISAAINLVARATKSDAANPSGSSEPPVGIVEIALKLWRRCVMLIRPPLNAELSSQLDALTNWLPALVDLGDELMRAVVMASINSYPPF